MGFWLDTAPDYSKLTIILGELFKVSKDRVLVASEDPGLALFEGDRQVFCRVSSEDLKEFPILLEIFLCKPENLLDSFYIGAGFICERLGCIGVADMASSKYRGHFNVWTLIQGIDNHQHIVVDERKLEVLGEFEILNYLDD